MVFSNKGPQVIVRSNCGGVFLGTLHVTKSCLDLRAEGLFVATIVNRRVRMLRIKFVQPGGQETRKDTDAQGICRIHRSSAKGMVVRTVF